MREYKNRPIRRKAIKESSLTRMWQHLGETSICFLTAYKDPDWIADNYELSYSDEDIPTKYTKRADEIKYINRQRNKALRQNIEALGFSFFMVDGSYENQQRKASYLKNNKGKNDASKYTDKEESFAVLKPKGMSDDAFIDDMFDLMVKYDQESMLFVPKGGRDGEFYYANGDVENAGNASFGADSPFKSLVNGRPFVMKEFIESVYEIGELHRPHIRTQYQYDSYRKASPRHID